MINADYDSFELGHFHRPPPHQSSPALPELGESSLLDRYLLRICESIKGDGLSSLYWVTGVHTQDIASALQSTLDEQPGTLKIPLESCCIVVKPWENRAVEAFSSRFGFSVRRMEEFYDDSFLIVNEAALLDVTPAAADEGSPEFNDDPTVVSLYIGLFNMLKNRSVRV